MAAAVNKNNAYSTLAGSLTNVSSSMTVGSGHGDRFPVVTAPDWAIVTLADAAGNIEIVKVTARGNGADTMAITRAQEGTAARAWSIGDIVELRPTAGTMATVDGVQTLTQKSISGSANTLTNVPTSALSVSPGVLGVLNAADVTGARTALGVTATGDAVVTAASAAAARSAIGAAASGPLASSGITGAAASGPLASSGITGAAASGANADITVLSALSTPLTPLQGGAQIQPITASVAANALTIYLDPTSLDFRNPALSAAAISRISMTGGQISVTISSGSTLGTFNGVKSRLVVLAINNSGTIELAVCNIAYNSALDETQVISTVAEGGAGAADSATVIYSTTARSGVPFRIVGYIESTQTTAGTWAMAPSLVQGAGGNAASQHMSLGYHQTWTGVTRTVGTTYYNDTGRPIILALHGTPDTSYAYIIFTIGGVTMAGAAAASSAYAVHQAVIPPGQTYSWSMSAGALTNITARELR